MRALRFLSGERVSLVGLPVIANGCTTLADGTSGAVLQPQLARALQPTAGMSRMSSTRLLVLAEELGTLVALEGPLTEPWIEYAALIERQAVAELARRAV